MARTTDKIKYNEKKKQAYSFFISKGYTPQQSAGIVANLMAESSLNTTIKGDKGSAVGIAQWRLDRRERLESKYGDNWHSFENQLDFVDWELKNTHQGAYKALQGATTAAEAALVISDKYERPHPDWAHNEKRQKNAIELASEYGGLPLENLTNFDKPTENRTFASQLSYAGEQKFIEGAQEDNYRGPTADISFEQGVELPAVDEAVEEEVEKEEGKVSEAQQRIQERMKERNMLISFLKSTQYESPEYKRTNAFAGAPPQEYMQEGGKYTNRLKYVERAEQKPEHIQPFNYQEDLGFLEKNLSKVLLGEEKLDEIEGIYNKLVDFKNKRKDDKMTEEEVDLRKRIANAKSFNYPSNLFQLESFVDNVLKGEKEEGTTKNKNKKILREALNNKYYGLDYNKDIVTESPYKPSDAKDKNAVYYTLKGKESEVSRKGLKDKYENFEKFYNNFKGGKRVGASEVGGSGILSQFGKFKMSSGEDENGKYVSFYDIWDIDPPMLKDRGIDLNKLNYPFEVYDRIYEKDFNKF